MQINTLFNTMFMLLVALNNSHTSTMDCMEIFYNTIPAHVKKGVIEIIYRLNLQDKSALACSDQAHHYFLNAPETIKELVHKTLKSGIYTSHEDCATHTLNNLKGGKKYISHNNNLLLAYDGTPIRNSLNSFKALVSKKYIDLDYVSESIPFPIAALIAQAGLPQELALLLNKRLDPNQRIANSNNTNLLYEIATNRYHITHEKLTCLKMLLESKADPNVYCHLKNKMYPIHFVFLNGLHYAQLLVNHNANVNVVDQHKQTSLHEIVGASHFSAKEQLSIISLLIKADADLTLRNQQNETPYDIAAKSNHKTFTFMKEMSKKKK